MKGRMSHPKKTRPTRQQLKKLFASADLARERVSGYSDERRGEARATKTGCFVKCIFLKTRWIKVSSPRNSTCHSAKLSALDFSRWFSDDSLSSFYLHVDAKDGDTSHRVYCRFDQCPRIGQKGGEIYWLVNA